MATAVFHLAFPVYDIEKTRSFYVDILGCTVGREDKRWIDFNFHGHQISAHLYDHDDMFTPSNPVDEHDVPVRHFGIVLNWGEWEHLAERLKREQVKFHIEPCIRFKGQIGEQATMFIQDPSNNYLEFKSFKDMSQIFAKE